MNAVDSAYISCFKEISERVVCTGVFSSVDYVYFSDDIRILVPVPDPLRKQQPLQHRINHHPQRHHYPGINLR